MPRQGPSTPKFRQNRLNGCLVIRENVVLKSVVLVDHDDDDDVVVPGACKI